MISAFTQADLRDRLARAQKSTKVITELVDEVGRNLAELVHAAKESRGRVIRSLPIHRVKTFGEEEAALEEYAPLVMTASSNDKGCKRHSHKCWLIILGLIFAERPQGCIDKRMQRGYGQHQGPDPRF